MARNLNSFWKYKGFGNGSFWHNNKSFALYPIYYTFTSTLYKYCDLDLSQTHILYTNYFLSSQYFRVYWKWWERLQSFSIIQDSRWPPIQTPKCCFWKLRYFFLKKDLQSQGWWECMQNSLFVFTFEYFIFLKHTFLHR